jgi:hypothetical protein
MALLIRAILALAVGGLATVSGLDRDRAFYPTVTIVVASYYALFAVLGDRRARCFSSRWSPELSLRLPPSASGRPSGSWWSRWQPRIRAAT